MTTEKWKIGDHVSWNWRRGRTHGKITKIHTEDVAYKGRNYRATEDDPRYEVQSDKSGKIALHKGTALQRKE